MNIAVVGHRGSGKTTLCHRLAGFDAPVHPGGTQTLNYVGCKWNNKDVLIWDFPPGFSPETLTFLDDIVHVVVCVDGLRNESTRSCLMALEELFDGNVSVAVTKASLRTVCLPFVFFGANHSGKVADLFFCAYDCRRLRNSIISNSSA
tara:strand:+ start:370 stop:813 length:444 start_codon:yes stop_codon:yes gene_type:complete